MPEKTIKEMYGFPNFMAGYQTVFVEEGI